MALLPLKSVRAQLVFWNALTLAGIFLVVGGIVDYAARATLVSGIDKELTRRTNRFGGPPNGFGPNGPNGGPNGPNGGPDGGRGGGPDQNGGPNGPNPNGGPDNGFGRRGGGPDGPQNGQPGRNGPPDRFGAEFPPRVFGPEGKSVNVQNPQVPYDASVIKRSLAGETVIEGIVFNGENIRLISRPFPDHSVPQGVVQLGYPMAEVEVALVGIRRALLLLLPAALLAAGLVANVLTRRVLRPISLITLEAESIGSEDLARRLHTEGQDEFSQLGETFNQMLGRLEHSFNEEHKLVEQLRESVEKQKRFTADASHELRTPLTIIKANASLALSGNPTTDQYKTTVEQIDQAADNMSVLVTDLLTLARSDTELVAREKSPVDVHEIVKEAIERCDTRDGAKIEVKLPREMMFVSGIYDDLVRLLVNLVQNALRYTPTTGSVTVSAIRAYEAITIKVQDTGSGIAAQHVSHLGERFYRAESSRNRKGGGSGLGLAICKGIAAAHGGTLAIESEVDKGTTVTVTLPSANEEDLLGSD
ncbi:MAG: HAMP domain-containing sensor histidine kinase [Chthonomonadales bacterium]